MTLGTLRCCSRHDCCVPASGCKWHHTLLWRRLRACACGASDRPQLPRGPSTNHHHQPQVWMANTRSNTFSRGNRHYTELDEGYWHFSLDELALLDLPAQINFILKKIDQPTLGFVGHSQGCTLPLMLMAAQPEYAKKFWLLMLLGAVTHAQFIQAPFLRNQMIYQSGGVYAMAGIGEVGRTRVASIMVSSCKYEGVKTGYCSALINFVVRGGWRRRESSAPHAGRAACWAAVAPVRLCMLHLSVLLIPARCSLAAAGCALLRLVPAAPWAWPPSSILGPDLRTPTNAPLPLCSSTGPRPSCRPTTSRA